ncbi:MAG: class I SAM-dependent methyltransferase, partial [Candidatus Aureabacteria bacterium]|nr:class I SAM-dependent methyltransferase [Candidatus Auribacterota bacterium]
FTELHFSLIFEKSLFIKTSPVKTDYSITTPDIETSSEEYALRFKGAVGEWFLKVQEEAVLSMLTKKNHATVLDVGGGHGQMLPGLINHNFQVTVLGSSTECKKRIQPYLDRRQMQFQTGDLMQLPFSDQLFDAAISLRLLTHLEKWTLLVKELCRVSKKTVIVDFPVWKSLNIFSDFLFSLKKNVEKNTRTYTLFYESEIVKEFKLNGYTPCRKIPQFFLPMALHRMMNHKPFSLGMETFFRMIKLTSWFGSPLLYEFERIK